MGEGNDETILFTKNADPFEKTVYFFQEDFLVSLSYSATVKKDDAEEQLLKVQKTWKILSEEERENNRKKAEESLQ